jgi:hypothetical protein
MPVHGHLPNANSHLSYAALAIPDRVPRAFDELFVKAACLVLLPISGAGKYLTPKGCIGFVKLGATDGKRRRKMQKSGRSMDWKGLTH